MNVAASLTDLTDAVLTASQHLLFSIDSAGPSHEADPAPFSLLSLRDTTRRPRRAGLKLGERTMDRSTKETCT